MDLALNSNKVETLEAAHLNHMVHPAKVRKMTEILFWDSIFNFNCGILGGFGSQQQQQQPGSSGSFGNRPSQSYGAPSQGIYFNSNFFLKRFFNQKVFRIRFICWIKLHTTTIWKLPFGIRKSIQCTTAKQRWFR